MEERYQLVAPGTRRVNCKGRLSSILLEVYQDTVQASPCFRMSSAEWQCEILKLIVCVSSSVGTEHESKAWHLQKRFMCFTLIMEM